MDDIYIKGLIFQQKGHLFKAGKSHLRRASRIRSISDTSLIWGGTTDKTCGKYGCLVSPTHAPTDGRAWHSRLCEQVDLPGKLISQQM